MRREGWYSKKERMKEYMRVRECVCVYQIHYGKESLELFYHKCWSNNSSLSTASCLSPSPFLLSFLLSFYPFDKLLSPSWITSGRNFLYIRHHRRRSSRQQKRTGPVAHSFVTGLWTDCWDACMYCITVHNYYRVNW